MIPKELILALLPILIIQVALQVFCIIDIYRRKKYLNPNNLNVWVWLLVILVCGVLGSIAYLLFGRRESNE